MGPGIRALLVAPHLEEDLQRLLETLEALLERWVGDAERQVFTLAPGRPDAEERAPLAEDVEGRDDLGEDAQGGGR